MFVKDYLTMDAQALVLFAEIVEAGNLSRAASTMKVSRANISYHLAQLEKTVGMQLIRRTTRRLELTEVGERMLQHGRAIRNEMAAARESIVELGEGLKGAVRLSLPTGLGHAVMSNWLIEFKREYPHISLSVLFDNRVDDLLRDEVDIAIRVMSDPPQHLVATELASVRYVTCASVAYASNHPMPLQLEDLAAVPLITSTVVGRELRLTAHLGADRREMALRPNIASENFHFLRKAILAGLGVGLVPDYLVKEDIAQQRVTTSLDEWHLSVFGSRMFLLRMPGRYQTLAVRTLIDFIVQRTRAWAA